MTIQQQIDKLDALSGKVGRHSDLANELEEIGFDVRVDSENNERSEIYLQGCWDDEGRDIMVAEIIGDAEAKIV